MSKELYEGRYCIDCGRPLRVSKRMPRYDGGTGELLGTHFDLVCSSNPWNPRHMFRCHYGVYWAYDAVERHSRTNKASKGKE